MNRDPEREPSGARAEALAPSSSTVPVVAAQATQGKPVATEISLVGLANVLINRWKLVVGLPFGAALVAEVVSLVLPPGFTATATFVLEPQSAGPFEEDLEGYSDHHYARLGARPGITGLWQVNGRSSVMDFEEVVRMDREYIDRWSLGLDLNILARTIPAVVRRTGAY